MERAHFGAELEALRGQLSHMARVAVEALEEAVGALVNHRPDALDRINTAENTLNDLQMAIDDHALRLVALQQPAASDLRLILAAVRANVDIERVGDHAVNLGALATRLAARAPNPVEPTIVGMAELALAMLRDAVKAFVDRDPALARDVLRRDEVQDREFRSVFPVIIGQLRETPAGAEASLNLLLFARNLERIADHATNIAEQAIFVVEARDVRHGQGE